MNNINKLARTDKIQTKTLKNRLIKENYALKNQVNMLLLLIT